MKLMLIIFFIGMFAGIVAGEFARWLGIWMANKEDGK